MLAKAEGASDAEMGGNNGTGAEAIPSATPVPPPDVGADYDDSEPYTTGNENEDREDITAEGKRALGKLGKTVFNNGGYPLFVFIASIVLMIAASVLCNQTKCKGTQGWAVAGGVISIVVSGIYLFLERKENLEPKVRLAITTFLFIWWIFLAAFVTFQIDAMAKSANQYFAIWGGLIASLMMTMNEFAKVRDTLDRFAKLGHKVAILLAASIIVFGSGIAACNNGCSGQAAYAISAGVISFCIMLVPVFMRDKLNTDNMRMLSMFMVVWWTIGLVILTFIGPFKTSGNGYFATWACLIASILMMNPL